MKMSSFNLNQDYHDMIVRYVPASDDCNILSANIGNKQAKMSGDVGKL